MKATPALLAVMIVLSAAKAPLAQEPASDQSLDRMKAVLQRAPLRMTPVEPEANFKIHIEAIHPMHDIFEKPAWQLDPIGWQPPAVGFNLLALVQSGMRAAANARRERDWRLAREEVQRQIADYCAQQPNANLIQICVSQPTIR
jgi:hypothetical protein